ncbi:RES family NAD+ phosphorylase [Ningiella sp. W23]|uniref:RES family NAD+ phosphorylase n=1 Tax=Ningiella sp. W23 TaxID=3023715 RepID=UPI0037579F4F
MFRLAVKKYCGLEGLGGLYGDGRWHTEGQPVLYTASSRSLAVLERFVHEESIDLPDLMMVTVHIPDDLPFDQYTSAELPLNWDTTNAGNQTDTQDIGTAFLQKGHYGYMRVPSAIIPHEYNYIINPLHHSAMRISLIEKHPYRYDSRYQRFIKSDISNSRV